MGMGRRKCRRGFDANCGLRPGNFEDRDENVMSNAPYVLIAPDVKLGRNVRLFGYANLYGCELGDDVKVGPFVEIQKGVKVGNRCKISSHSFLCQGVVLEDDVFVGHNVTFTNDLYPRATNGNGQLQTESDWECLPTVVKRGASIGSGATLLCGITIGENALIGAGSVVVRDVPADTVVAGNPARPIRSVAGRDLDHVNSALTGGHGRGSK